MTTPRLRLPAYAKSLLANRRRGFHPSRVEVYFGDDWRVPSETAKREAAVFVRDGLRAVPYGEDWLREVGTPMLAVRPREFAAGVFDWRAVVATRVCVVDGCGALADFDCDTAGDPVTRWGLIYALMGDVARYAAEVWYREGLDGAEQDAEALAYGARTWDALQGAMVWPDWWPNDDSIKADRERRKAVWRRAEFGRAAVTASRGG